VSFITIWREDRHSYDAGLLLVRELVETDIIIVGAGARVITYWREVIYRVNYSWSRCVCNNFLAGTYI